MFRRHWVLNVAGILLLLAAAWFLAGDPLWRSLADRSGQARPVITVEAAYPGANASVVADTVAAPIEQQVLGVEGMVHLTSRCCGDGSCTLTAAFKPGTDMAIAQVLVQNRVALAMPVLPDAVKQLGVTIRKQSPGVLLLLAVSSPDDSRDLLYLGHYACALLKDELSRLEGVGAVTAISAPEASVRIRIDPAKLAALDLTAGDVVKALEGLKMPLQPDAGRGEKTEIKLLPKDREPLPDLEQLEKIVLKTTPRGRVVYLKDVARIDVGGDVQQGVARLNGKPVVVLALSPLPSARPREVSTAVAGLLKRLRPKVPDGVRVDAAFDFATNLDSTDGAHPEYLLVDPALPLDASAQRRSRLLEECEALLRKAEGVQDVLALPDNPFDGVRDRPCILVRLAADGKERPARGEIARTIRTRLGEIKGLKVRLRDLAGASRFPRCGYPIELALHGPEQDRVAEWADKVAERLAQSEKLTDVWANPEARPRRQLDLVIDRTQMLERGVSLKDALATLEIWAGSLPGNDANRFGRTWQVTIQGPAADHVEDLKSLKVRNGKGDMVPLAAFLTIRDLKGPMVLDRFDGQPMVEITANLLPGTVPGTARALCESVAEEVRMELKLPAEYRLSWLSH